MKRIIFSVTVHLNIHLSLALLQPEPALEMREEDTIHA